MEQVFKTENYVLLRILYPNMRKNEDTVSHTVTPKKKKIAFHMTFLKELPEDVLQ